jgi:hypothetical protein
MPDLGGERLGAFALESGAMVGAANGKRFFEEAKGL